MKTTYKFSSIVIVVAAAALLYLYRSPDNQTSKTHRASSANEPRYSSTGNSIETLSPTKSSKRKILDASTAGSLIASVDKSQSLGEEVFLRIQIAQVCEQPMFVQTNKPQSESTRALASFRKSFCADYSGSISSEQAKLLAIPGNDVYQATYGMSAELFDAVARQKPGSEDVAAISKQLDEVILSKDSRMEALIAAEALHQVGLISPQTLKFVKSNDWELSQRDLAEAQLISVQMKVCKEFGGCGVNQLTTMKLCSERSTCAIGASADSSWRLVNSPAVYEAAKRLSMIDPQT